MSNFNDEQHQEVGVNTDAITEDVNAVMKQKLLHERWNAKKVEVWSKDIIEATLKRLAEAKAAYKYVVTCCIMQRTGAGLTAAFATRWDQSRDAFVSVPFESEHLHCIVTVYWIKLE